MYVEMIVIIEVVRPRPGSNRIFCCFFYKHEYNADRWYCRKIAFKTKGFLSFKNTIMSVVFSLKG